jgi:molecular chaperone Hsp33
MSDTLHRFLFEDAGVRGEIVTLDAAWREVLDRHGMPASVRDRLGELTAAGLLLAASLKFDGSLILQIHGDGPVALLVVECDANGTFRSTVKLREGPAPSAEATLRELVDASGRGRFAVTLDPRTRTPARQPYQGIVPFEGEQVSDVLERYMARSEQVPTRIWLAADAHRAVGLLLQRLPSVGGHAAPARDEDAWPRMQKLAETITPAELLGLEPQQVLRRLFWQERLVDFEARTCRFACSCSRERVSAMLKMLGQTEVDGILAERGTVEVRCEYCNTPYAFDRVDCARLFLEGLASEAPDRPQ